MLRLGIVGLPNVGKSTLFNALTSSKAAAAENYPFCTVEPNVGVVEVRDPRLEALKAVDRPRTTMPAALARVGIACVVEELNAGRAAREAGENAAAIKYLRTLGLLTAKPILYAANVDETNLASGGGKWIDKLRAAVQSHHEEAEIVPFSAKFEAELG